MFAGHFDDRRLTTAATVEKLKEEFAVKFSTTNGVKKINKYYTP